MSQHKLLSHFVSNSHFHVGNHGNRQLVGKGDAPAPIITINSALPSPLLNPHNQISRQMNNHEKGFAPITESLLSSSATSTHEVNRTNARWIAPKATRVVEQPR